MGDTCTHLELRWSGLSPDLHTWLDCSGPAVTSGRHLPARLHMCTLRLVPTESFPDTPGPWSECGHLHAGQQLNLGGTPSRERPQRQAVTILHYYMEALKLLQPRSLQTVLSVLIRGRLPGMAAVTEQGRLRTRLLFTVSVSAPGPPTAPPASARRGQAPVTSLEPRSEVCEHCWPNSTSRERNWATPSTQQRDGGHRGGKPRNHHQTAVTWQVLGHCHPALQSPKPRTTCDEQEIMGTADSQCSGRPAGQADDPGGFPEAQRMLGGVHRSETGIFQNAHDTGKSGHDPCP